MKIPYTLTVILLLVVCFGALIGIAGGLAEAFDLDIPDWVLYIGFIITVGVFGALRKYVKAKYYGGEEKTE